MACEGCYLCTRGVILGDFGETRLGRETERRRASSWRVGAGEYGMTAVSVSSTEVTRDCRTARYDAELCQLFLHLVQPNCVVPRSPPGTAPALDCWPSLQAPTRASWPCQAPSWLAHLKTKLEIANARPRRTEQPRRSEIPMEFITFDCLDIACRERTALANKRSATSIIIRSR